MDTPSKKIPVPVTILLGVALNFTIGLAMIEIKKIAGWDTSIYLDAIGTIAITLLSGSRAGAAVGVFSTIIGGVKNFHLFYFVITQIAIAAFTGFAAKRGGFKNFAFALPTGVALGFIAALVSAPASALAFRDPATFVTSTGEFLGKVFLTSEVWTEPLDKVLQCLAALAVVGALPKDLRERFGTSPIPPKTGEPA